MFSKRFLTLLVEYSHNKSSPCQFGGHRPCGCRDTTDLIFLVTLQEHVVLCSCDLLGRSHSRQVSILPSFMAGGIVVVEICFQFVDYVTLCVEAALGNSPSCQVLWPQELW